MPGDSSNRSRIPTELLQKLRITGFSFREIGQCAGISRRAVIEHLKNNRPDCLDLQDYKDHEAHYYDLEACKAFSFGSIVHDKAMQGYIANGRLDTQAINAAYKLARS
jgi:hypothetical protein